MGYKITKEDRKVFRKETRKWLDLLGMHHWDCGIKFRKLIAANNAECWADDEGGVAVITCGLDVEEKREIPLYSHHEVRELQLYPLRILLRSRGVEDVVTNKMFHEIINQEEACLKKLGVLPDVGKVKEEG